MTEGLQQSIGFRRTRETLCLWANLEQGPEVRSARKREAEGEPRARGLSDAQCPHCSEPRTLGTLADQTLQIRREVSLEGLEGLEGTKSSGLRKG